MLTASCSLERTSFEPESCRWDRSYFSFTELVVMFDAQGGCCLYASELVSVNPNEHPVHVVTL